VIKVVPFTSPFTTPVADPMVATPVPETVHVPPADPSLSDADEPAQTLLGPPIVAGNGLTV